MDLPLPTAAARQVFQSRDGALLTLCAATRRLRRAASGPATPTAQEAPGRGACTHLLHGRRVGHGAFPCASPQQGNAPLGRDRDACFEPEERPHVPDTWMDHSKDEVVCEINFNWRFYQYPSPQPLEVIDAELKEAEEEILRLLREVTE